MVAGHTLFDPLDAVPQVPHVGAVFLVVVAAFGAEFPHIGGEASDGGVGAGGAVAGGFPVGGLGGEPARWAAEAFWTDPTPATWADYERLCRPHYNTTPTADLDAKARTIAVDDILCADDVSLRRLTGGGAARSPASAA